MTTTKPSQVDYKGLKKEHASYWANYIKETNYNVKVIFSQNKELVTKLFENEIIKGDFYCEFVNTDESFFHSERKLYKYIPRRDFEKRYKQATSRDDLYIVPISDFELVATQSSAFLFGEVRSSSKSSKNTSSDYIPKENGKSIDDSIGGAVDNTLLQITIRDLFAIIHKTPISNNEEINNLIRKYI